MPLTESDLKGKFWECHLDQSFQGKQKVMGRKKELIYPVGNKGRQWNESPFHWVLLVTEIQGTREPQELTTSSNLGGERVGKGWNCYLDHFEPPVGMVIKGNLWVEQFGDKCWLKCPSQECTPTAFLPGPGRLYPSVRSCRAICSPVTSAGSEPKAIWVYTPMVSAYFHQFTLYPAR